MRVLFAAWLSLITLLPSLGLSATLVKNEPFRTVERRASTCTPTSAGSASTDDVPAIESAIASCGAGGTIYIPSGVTYMIRSTLSLDGCSGCTLQIECTLKASDDTDYWNGVEAIILVEDISGVTITSSTYGGLIDGNGQAAWDLFAEDTSFDRPTLLYITGSSDVTVSNLYFKNPPNVFISSTHGSSDATMKNLRLNAVSSNDNPPKNTDGFDIGQSTNIIVSNITVNNDDDCVAIKPGADTVSVTDISCKGSHGLSIGSLGGGEGSTDAVANIYFGNAQMSTSTKAAGIKLYPSGPDHGIATVSNVTWDGVTVDDCDYAFQIQSCYSEDEDYCDEYGNESNIEDVHVIGFTGTTSTKYAPDTANLNCPNDGTCDVTFEDWDIDAGSGTAVVLCANADDLSGVTCTSGASG